MDNRLFPAIIFQITRIQGWGFGDKGKNPILNYETIFTFRDEPSSLITSTNWPFSMYSPLV